MVFRQSVKVGFLCFGAAVLLSGCGLFNNNRWQGNDPDAQQRAEDPYHTDPKYMNGPMDYNPRVQNDSDRSVFSLFFDTVSFMPLASADPFGGVIITDWYSPPQTPNERFKVNIFILNKQLRADGVRASVFRQIRDAKGNWVDAAVDKNTPIDLENAILARARQIRLSTASIQQ
jgi:hypothetical protein